MAEDIVPFLCISYQGPKSTYLAQVYTHNIAGLEEI